MGQYYRIAFKTMNDISTTYNDCRYSGGKIAPSKLLEHSYIHNALMDSVAKFLFNNPSHIAWVGDYTKQKDLPYEIRYSDVWGYTPLTYEFKECKMFRYDKKYFINHSKKEYIAFTDYLNQYKEISMILNPISLLTAIGNGRGNGDYCGKNKKYIGCWAWDILEISSKLPEEYSLTKFYFKYD